MENTITTAEENQQGTTQPEGNGEKTFTQDEVNRIIGERLAKVKDKAKTDADLNKREQDLQQRELVMRAKELLVEKNLPKDLADILKYSDEESLKKAIDRIQELKSNEQNSYKVLGDNRLPESEGYDAEDYSLDKAFRLNRKE